MWLLIVSILISYIVGILMGKKFERDATMNGVYGIIADFDTEAEDEDDAVKSVTYYYSENAYREAAREVQKKYKGDSCHESENEYEENE